MAKERSVVDNAVPFGERLAASGTFKTLFRDGMALVEETAAYLDGAGREDAKALPRMAALAYASESMRLTTRLMQIASWLLLQRAINEGEMSRGRGRLRQAADPACVAAPAHEGECAGGPAAGADRA